MRQLLDLLIEVMEETIGRATALKQEQQATQETGHEQQDRPGASAPPHNSRHAKIRSMVSALGGQHAMHDTISAVMLSVSHDLLSSITQRIVQHEYCRNLRAPRIDLVKALLWLCAWNMDFVSTDSIKSALPLYVDDRLHAGVQNDRLHHAMLLTQRASASIGWDDMTADEVQQLVYEMTVLSRGHAPRVRRRLALLTWWLLDPLLLGRPRLQRTRGGPSPHDDKGVDSDSHLLQYTDVHLHMSPQHRAKIFAMLLESLNRVRQHDEVRALVANITHYKIQPDAAIHTIVMKHGGMDGHQQLDYLKKCVAQYGIKPDDPMLRQAIAALSKSADPNALDRLTEVWDLLTQLGMRVPVLVARAVATSYNARRQFAKTLLFYEAMDARSQFDTIMLLNALAACMKSSDHAQFTQLLDTISSLLDSQRRPGVLQYSSEQFFETPAQRTFFMQVIREAAVKVMHMNEEELRPGTKQKFIELADRLLRQEGELLSVPVPKKASAATKSTSDSDSNARPGAARK